MTATRALAVFAGISAAIIIITGLLLGTVFPATPQRQAILISAGLAFAVQLGAFALLAPGKAGQAAPGEIMIRWGMGAIIRLVTLVMFAVLAKGLQLPLAAALVSFGLFLFLTMIAEPVLLNHVR